MTTYTRREAARMVAGIAAAAAIGGSGSALAADDKTITIGITLPYTGADAESATRIKDGVVMAIDDANKKGEVKGYKLVPLLLDNGTATAGQYDPAQAATNARKLASDNTVMAAVGPEMSGSGKAMAPILNQASITIITPSATNPDITDPKFADQYMPTGKPTFFRTVTTDAYQGPNMANFFIEKLKAKSVYVLDDSGAYGVGIADAFQKEAEKKGMKVLGRDRLDPKAADYTTVLTKMKSLNPDSMYYGGVMQAGVKVVKQSYDILPKIIKAGGDGIYTPEMLTGAGFPAAEGWYATNASPHITDDPKAQAWVERYTKTFNLSPDDYSITAYDATLVIIDAIKRVIASGKPVTRAAVRAAVQDTSVETLQGRIKYDKNGDLVSKIVSVFQVERNPKYPADDMIHNFRYIGVAPQS